MVEKQLRLKAEFIRFIPPLLETLKSLGGSGRSSEVKDKIIDEMKITEEEQQELMKNGVSKVTNQIDWARFYLVKTDYLYSSSHGVWSLTDKGITSTLTRKDAEDIVIQVRKMFRNDKATGTEEQTDSETSDFEETAPDTGEDYREELLTTLRSLSAGGFERLSQRLLREHGFQKVVVTGRTGDGGIDGHGILQINPLISMQVVFQCKKYTQSVTASQVRDFRGAMAGRADKGIILTTGSFTATAKNEASRDGVPPIELVDGPKLIEMFESLQLGLKQKITYEIDEDFFQDYME